MLECCSLSDSAIDRDFCNTPDQTITTDPRVNKGMDGRLREEYDQQYLMPKAAVEAS